MLSLGSGSTDEREKRPPFRVSRSAESISQNPIPETRNGSVSFLDADRAAFAVEVEGRSAAVQVAGGAESVPGVRPPNGDHLAGEREAAVDVLAVDASVEAANLGVDGSREVGGQHQFDVSVRGAQARRVVAAEIRQ